jgi:membrane protease YdiL (CAAX protease family)
VADEGETSAQARSQIASARHSLIFVAIVAAVTAAGYAAQRRQVPGGGITASHAHAIPIYLSAAVLDWLLLLFAWRGIRSHGEGLGSVIRGRWASARDVLRDVALAALAWGVIAAAALGVEVLVGHGHEKTLGVLLPRTALEVVVWLFVCVTAGFCEELVFRGYVQRQLLAFTGSTTAAVLGQALVFAVMHAYQGWRAVAQIAVMGVLFGLLAVWRRTLRVGMIAHGWQDIWAGWLGAALFR